jgi:hypothetical protein
MVGGKVFKSFAVRGNPVQDGKTFKGWIVPGEEEIEAFMGESGKMWTPKKWKELTVETVKETLQI